MTIRRGLLPRSPARHSRIHPPYGKRFGEICPEKSTRVLELLRGIRVPVSYAGAVPGLIAGVLQATCQVPAAVEVGPDIPVRLIMGGTLSQIGLTMAIQ